MTPYLIAATAALLILGIGWVAFADHDLQAAVRYLLHGEEGE